MAKKYSDPENDEIGATTQWKEKLNEEKSITLAKTVLRLSYLISPCPFRVGVVVAALEFPPCFVSRDANKRKTFLVLQPGEEKEEWKKKPDFIIAQHMAANWESISASVASAINALTN